MSEATNNEINKSFPVSRKYVKIQGFFFNWTMLAHVLKSFQENLRGLRCDLLSNLLYLLEAGSSEYHLFRYRPGFLYQEQFGSYAVIKIDSIARLFLKLWRAIVYYLYNLIINSILPNGTQDFLLNFCFKNVCEEKHLLLFYLICS